MDFIEENRAKLRTITDEQEFWNAHYRISGQNKLASMLNLDDFKEALKNL